MDFTRKLYGNEVDDSIGSGFLKRDVAVRPVRAQFRWLSIANYPKHIWEWMLQPTVSKQVATYSFHELSVIDTNRKVPQLRENRFPDRRSSESEKINMSVLPGTQIHCRSF